MKTPTHRSPRAAWLFLAAPALLAVPALAQDAPTAPPPVRATLPQTAPAPAPAQTAPAAQTAQPATVPTTSRTTIAPGAADVVDEARIAAAREARRAPTRQVTRTTTTRTTTAAPTVAAPAPQPAAVAPPAETPVVAPEATAPASDTSATEIATATEAPVETATTTTTNDTGGTPLWPLAVVAALIVAAGAFFLLRRRRADAYEEEAYYEEQPAYVEPVAEPVHVAPVAVAAAPIAAAPAFDRVDTANTPVEESATGGLAEEPVVTDAPVEDVAALTDGAPPVRNRPWLEFAMRPVRAGTSADEALVEIELTVANSGNVEATDVRVSTFMLTDTHASEMERMMVDAPADAAIDPVTIPAGEGTRIDATLAALKSDLGVEGHFNPVVIAEARYRLPDGSEGRTAASFVVGVSDADGGAMTPIDLADRVMRDDVEAQLHGEVEHA